MNYSEKFIRWQIFTIIIGYVLIVALLAISTKIGLENINQINARLKTVVEQNNIKSSYLSEMSNAIQKRMILLHSAIHLDDPFEIDEVWLEYSHHARKFISSREKLQAMALTKEQIKQLDIQRSVLSKAQPLLDITINSIRDENKDRARSTIIEAQGLNQNVIDKLEEMRSLQQKIAEQAVVDSAVAIQEARQNIFLLISLIVVIALIILIGVIKIIKRQSNNVQLLVDELAESNNNLEQKVQERTAELLSSQEENARMSAELDVTTRLQQMLLPNTEELNNIPDLSISALMNPAEEAGGDYYDFLQYNDKTYLAIGDVTGHGLESSVVMLMAQTAVRTLTASGITELEAIVSALNKSLYDNLKRINSHKNLTFMLGHYSENMLTICGQHEEVLLIRNDQKDVEKIDTLNLGFPIGIEENIDEFLNTQQIKFYSGDTLVLYTDGIPEAENPAGQFYGIDNLCEQIKLNNYLPVEQMKDKIVEHIYQYIGKNTVYDDITLVIIRHQ